jgi:hypothetical protein
MSANGRVRASDEGLQPAYDCIVAALRKSESLFAIGTLARVGAYVSTAMKKEEAYLDVVATLGKREATLEAMGGIWPNGRLRIWYRIATAAKGPDAEIRAAALRSLGRGVPRTAEETTKVCSLLGELRAYPDAGTACTAVRLAARYCAADRDATIAAVEKLLAAKQFDESCAVALGADAATVGPPWTASQARRIATVLRRAASHPALQERPRGLALRTLARTDPAAAKRLAAGFAKPSASRELQRAAQDALEIAARAEAAKKAAAQQAAAAKKKPAPKK